MFMDSLTQHEKSNVDRVANNGTSRAEWLIGSDFNMIEYQEDKQEEVAVEE